MVLKLGINEWPMPGRIVFGLLFIWIATASPLAGLDHEMLTAHMAQHLLLMTLAPPLILLGVPQKAIGRPSRSEPMRQFASVVTHPAFCWFAAAATLVLWHIPSVFMLGLRSPMWHGAEQASFVVTGLLFWSPVVLPFVRPLSNRLKWPEWSILLYLFLATLPCDILSGFLVFCDRVVYPVFLSSPTFLWPLCSRRPAMCRRVDVDLRHYRLLNRRNNLHRAFTLTPSIAPTIPPTIR
jgi:putative membrane protein